MEKWDIAYIRLSSSKKGACYRWYFTYVLKHRLFKHFLKQVTSACHEEHEGFRVLTLPLTKQMAGWLSDSEKRELLCKLRKYFGMRYFFFTGDFPVKDEHYIIEETYFSILDGTIFDRIEERLSIPAKKLRVMVQDDGSDFACWCTKAIAGRLNTLYVQTTRMEELEELSEAIFDEYGLAVGMSSAIPATMHVYFTNQLDKNAKKALRKGLTIISLTV